MQHSMSKVQAIMLARKLFPDADLATAKLLIDNLEKNGESFKAPETTHKNCLHIYLHKGE